MSPRRASARHQHHLAFSLSLVAVLGAACAGSTMPRNDAARPSDTGAGGTGGAPADGPRPDGAGGGGSSDGGSGDGAPAEGGSPGPDGGAPMDMATGDDAPAGDRPAIGDLPVDAAAPPPDAAPPMPDMAPPAPDMTPPMPDMAPPTPDAAPPVPDAAPPMPDAAPPMPDVAPPPPDLAPDLPPPPDLPPLGPAVVISEIMYHPVDELSTTDQHEFVELHNRWPYAVSVAGWRLAGEVSFTFPAGTTLPAGAYVVVARNRTGLVGVYGLDPTLVFGDYTGQLDNGGGVVAILDQAGNVIDSARYDDAFPWPIAADALGAGESWLPAALLPLASHRNKGRSLERYDFMAAGADVFNWAPSPLDGATPTRANSVSGTPPPVVTARSAAPTAGGTLIRNDHEVLVRATFSSTANLSDVRLEWFVDDLSVTTEPVTSTSMTAAGGGAYEARLAPRPDGTIVRYRFAANRGSGLEVISPRPTDPMAFHAYFVSPTVATSAPVYQLYISKANWTRLYDNTNYATNERRVNGCAIRDSWNERVPAVFVLDGVVYDTRVRYQGSRWNRLNGLNIDTTKTTISPLPDRPSPVRALSWNISFPRYGRVEGRSTLTLNKLNQSCPGLDQSLGERLYEGVGLPVSRTRFVRLHVNGGYYHYMLDLEHMDDDVLKRHVPARQPVGDLFKSEGCNCDEGPYGWGDARPLATSCGYTPLQRYQATYDRKTHEWAGHDDLKQMIDDLTTARASLPTTTATRAFFSQHFDVPSMLSYLAVRNWAEPWDDFFQNHFLYRKPDGKWMMIPWDLDREFGENFSWSATRSFFIGEQNNPDNRNASWNRLKDAFIKAYRTELSQKIVELDGTVLAPANVKAKIDQAAALFSLTDAQASPAGYACSFATEVTNLKKFADDRHAEVLRGID